MPARLLTRWPLASQSASAVPGHRFALHLRSASPTFWPWRYFSKQAGIPCLLRPDLPWPSLSRPRFRLSLFCACQHHSASLMPQDLHPIAPAASLRAATAVSAPLLRTAHCRPPWAFQKNRYTTGSPLPTSAGPVFFGILPRRRATTGKSTERIIHWRRLSAVVGVLGPRAAPHAPRPAPFHYLLLRKKKLTKKKRP